MIRTILYILSTKDGLNEIEFKNIAEQVPKEDGNRISAFKGIIRQVSAKTILCRGSNKR